MFIIYRNFLIIISLYIIKVMSIFVIAKLKNYRTDYDQTLYTYSMGREDCFCLFEVRTIDGVIFSFLMFLRRNSTTTALCCVSLKALGR